MGKIGFNCQLPLSEIGLTTDSSHSTWFHKTVRFSRSKASSEEDLAQHVLFDTGRRRTRLGILKKIEESEPSQDDTDQPLLLAPKILPFPKELELHLFSISIQEFLCVSTPLWDPEKWTNSFRDRICNLLSSYLAGITSVEKMIHSDRHESPTTLHCQNPCCIFEREEVDLLASLMVQSSSRWAPFLLGPQRQNVGLVPTVHHVRKGSLSRDH